MPKIAQCLWCGRLIRRCEWENCEGYTNALGYTFTGWVHGANPSVFDAHFCADGHMAMPDTADATAYAGS